MAKSPEEQTAAMVATLKEKTGRALEEWIALGRASGKAKHGELVGHLKAEHGLTHGYANLVAHKMLGSDAGSAVEAGEDLVGAQYAGAKANLRPIYDAILKAVNGFGADVEAAPKKAYVSLRRTKQFAIVQPSTATRLDLGLNLKGVEPAGRLEASGSFNSMVSHRVKLASVAEVDKELIGWLKQAYEGA